MARFDVYRLRTTGALVLDLQADLLDNLATRVVAPLLSPEEFPLAMARLNPRFEVEGRTVVLALHMIGTIPTKHIAEVVGNLSHRRDRIVAATDFLFQGF